MNKIINYIKGYQDRRLRERCVKYASNCTKDVASEASHLYFLIKDGQHKRRF